MVNALIGGVGPSVNMIGLSFNMAATNHTLLKKRRDTLYFDKLTFSMSQKKFSRQVIKMTLLLIPA